MLRMLVSIGLIPTALKENHAAITERVTKAVAVRRKQMILDSAASPSFGLQQSCELLDNVVGALAYALTTSFEEPRARTMRFRIAWGRARLRWVPLRVRARLV